MYSTERIQPRPPGNHALALPRSTFAVEGRNSNERSDLAAAEFAGNPASRVAVVTFPTPGTLSRSSAFCRQVSEAEIGSRISRSTTASWSFSDHSKELINLHTDLDPRSRRLDTAVIISVNCR
jgi:hypothetical protein